MTGNKDNFCTQIIDNALKEEKFFFSGLVVATVFLISPGFVIPVFIVNKNSELTLEEIRYLLRKKAIFKLEEMHSENEVEVNKWIYWDASTNES